MTMIDTEVSPVRALTAQDRCDRCGAQAYVAAQYGGDPTREGIQHQGELLFCAHHAREHGEALATHITLDTATERLNVRSDTTEEV